MSAVRINHPTVFRHNWNGDMLTVEAVDGRKLDNTVYLFGSPDEWSDFIAALTEAAHTGGPRSVQ